MSHLPEIDLKPIGPYNYRVKERYVYEWIYKRVRRRIIIPADFETDLGSIPRIFWWFFGPHDLGFVPVVLHDLGYHYAGVFPPGMHQKLVDGGWVDVEEAWPREEWEGFFGAVMRQDGVVRWKRRAAERIVRIFGGFRWRKRRRQLWEGV